MTKGRTGKMREICIPANLNSDMDSIVSARLSKQQQSLILRSTSHVSSQEQDCESSERSLFLTEIE